jgi:acyl carrier protein
MSAANTPHDALVGWLCVTIARACRVEPSRVTATSPLLELGLDSLTLVSVLTQVETAHAIELAPDETLALLEAADVGSLAARLTAIVDARRLEDASG